jgi:2'-5' RNA ligase
VRLFTAVYPSTAASAHLDLALGGVGGSAVADPGAGLRWVPKEQRHVTLAFHGEVPDGAVPGYVDALGTALAGVQAFELALAGGGSFGGRTLWVGLSGALDAVRRLAALVEEAAAEAGLPADDRAPVRARRRRARPARDGRGSAARAARADGRRTRHRRSPTGRGRSRSTAGLPGPSRRCTWSRRSSAPGGPEARCTTTSRSSSSPGDAIGIPGDAVSARVAPWRHDAPRPPI